jgi:hypothetical protein
VGGAAQGGIAAQVHQRYSACCAQQYRREEADGEGQEAATQEGAQEGLAFADFDVAGAAPDF